MNEGYLFCFFKKVFFIHTHTHTQRKKAKKELPVDLNVFVETKRKLFYIELLLLKKIVCLKLNTKSWVTLFSHKINDKYPFFEPENNNSWNSIIFLLCRLMYHISDRPIFKRISSCIVNRALVNNCLIFCAWRRLLIMSFDCRNIFHVFWLL